MLHLSHLEMILPLALYGHTANTVTNTPKNYKLTKKNNPPKFHLCYSLSALESFQGDSGGTAKQSNSYSRVLYLRFIVEENKNVLDDDQTTGTLTGADVSSTLSILCVFKHIALF